MRVFGKFGTPIAAYAVLGLISCSGAPPQSSIPPPRTSDASSSFTVDGAVTLRTVQNAPQYYTVTGPRGVTYFPHDARFYRSNKALIVHAYGTSFTFKADQVRVSGVNVDSPTPVYKSLPKSDTVVDEDRSRRKSSACPDCAVVATPVMIRVPQGMQRYHGALAMDRAGAVITVPYHRSSATQASAGQRSAQSVCVLDEPYYANPVCFYDGIGLFYYVEYTPSFSTIWFGDAINYFPRSPFTYELDMPQNISPPADFFGTFYAANYTPSYQAGTSNSPKGTVKAFVGTAIGPFAPNFTQLEASFYYSGINIVAGTGVGYSFGIPNI